MRVEKRVRLEAQKYTALVTQASDKPSNSPSAVQVGYAGATRASALARYGGGISRNAKPRAKGI